MGRWFFDRFGSPKILWLQNNRFIDRFGKNLGYIFEDKVYNYVGKHCGWIEGGVIRDIRGHVVAFSVGASDSPSPLFPIPQVPPIPPIPQIPPIPGIRQIPNIRPIKTFSWSSLLPEQFFL